MSVNSMSFNDASALLNEVRKQMTGETAIAPINGGVCKGWYYPFTDRI